MSSSKAGYSRVAKVGVLWCYGSLLNELVNIPTTVITARLLSPYEFGVVAAAAFFTRLAARLMNFGFNQALVRLKEIRPEHYASLFVVNLVLGTLLWGVLILLAPWIGASLKLPETSKVIPFAALGFVIDAVGSVPAAMMQRQMQFWQKAVSGWISALTISCTAITLAWSGFGYWSLVYASLAGTTAQALTLTVLTGWRPRLVFSRQAMRDLLSFGMGVHSKRMLDFAALNLDNLVVGRVLGGAALGLYDKAFMIMNKVVNQLNVGGADVSFRIFALIHEEPARFRAAYCKVVMTAALISFPPLTMCIVVAPELFVTLFGERWLAAVVPFQVLCAAGMLRLLNQYVSAATQAIGWVWAEVWRQVIHTALIVGGIALLSRSWGLNGAAAGLLMATAVMTVLMHAMLIRATGLSWGRLSRAVLAASVCSVGLAGTLIFARMLVRAYVIEPTSWLLLLCESGAGFAFYAAFVLFAPFAEVRRLVDETITDFLPGWAAAFLRPGSQAQTPQVRNL